MSRYFIGLKRNGLKRNALKRSVRWYERKVQREGEMLC